ncbi:protein-tyrosine phosphatase family protein [Nocardia araoensis]|uniref:protein-tyrosine phosphatase family protein n=1 Tax=Nocardia araoensis TaxID=228600 RepID=UPI00030DAE30|nr:protein-tyrosine phosphatase family protein [Nocardia araoensis]
MTVTWDSSTPGLLALPSGRSIRGRALRRPMPGGPVPEFGLYLLEKQPPSVAWSSRWIRWPDFWLPSDRTDAYRAMQEAWKRSDAERVEVACNGGRGRTGTALACIAVLDGIPAHEAVTYIRTHYSPHAVETPWQRRFVHRFTTPADR